MQTKQIDLIINKMSRAKYDLLSAAGKIKIDELYFINDDTLNAYDKTISRVGTPTLSSDAANKQYVDSEIAKIPSLSTATTLHLGGIKIGFSSANHNYAVLIDENDKAYVNVPWTDVAISSARYDSASKKIILVFNDETKTALSVDVADLVDTYTAGEGLKLENNKFSVSADYAKVSSLTAYETKADLTSNYYTKNDLSTASLVNTALSQKQPVGNYLTSIQAGNGISVDGNTVGISATYANIKLDGTDTTEFNVVHISRDEYATKVKADDGSILSNTLYVISSESINAYGQLLKNLAAPTDLSDAVTLEYADGRYLTAHQSLDNYYTKTQTDALSTTFRNGLATEALLNEKITLSDLCLYYYYLDTSSLPASYRVGEFYAYKTNTENVYKSEVNFKQCSLELNETTGGWKIYYNGSVARSGTAVKQSNGDFYESTLGFTIYRKLYANDSDMLDGMHLSAISANIIHSADSKYLHSDITSIKKLDHYSEKADIYKNGGITLDYTAKLTLVSDFGQIGILSGRTLQDELDKIPSISVDGIHTDELHLKHVSVQEYALILEEGALSNALYVISSDENDMMGERIINVADPVELSDATNKHYVDDNISVATTPEKHIVKPERIYDTNNVRTSWWGTSTDYPTTFIKINDNLYRSSVIDYYYDDDSHIEDITEIVTDENALNNLLSNMYDGFGSNFIFEIRKLTTSEANAYGKLAGWYWYDSVKAFRDFTDRGNALDYDFGDVLSYLDVDVMRQNPNVNYTFTDDYTIDHNATLLSAEDRYEYTNQITRLAEFETATLSGTTTDGQKFSFTILVK